MGGCCVVVGLCGMAGKAVACVCWFMLWSMSRAVIASLPGFAVWLGRRWLASAGLCLGQCLWRLMRRCRALRYGWEGYGLRLLAYAWGSVSGAYCVVAGLCGMAGKPAARVRWLMLWAMSRAFIASLPGSAVWLVSWRFAFADLRWGQCLGRLMRRCRALRYVWQASGLSGAPADAKSAAEPLEIRISAAANQKAV